MRYAIRSLLRQPLFTLSAVATLALGIGVNSTLFTVANAAFFRGMPGIAAPERLAWVSSVWRDRGREVGMSYPDYADYREATLDVFADIFAFRPTPLSLGSGGEPQRIRGHLVTGSYFETLGVTPAAGRLIAATDDRAGTPAMAVIGYRLWRERFAAAPDITASTVTLNGRQFAVIGVAPEHFSGPALGEAADVWLPMVLAPELRTNDRDILTNRGSSWFLVMGRLRDNITIADARAAVSAVASRLEQAYPDSNTSRLATVSSAESGLPPEGHGEFLPLGALLLIVTGIVLMIACANVANLLLARGAARSLEMSIRAAIGASTEPLGREISLGSTKLHVVGVARDSKYDEATEDTRPFLYTSLDQAAQLDREAVILRAASAPAALTNALRATVHALDPALPVFELRTLDDVLHERADKERGISVLLGAFGAMALLLASLGLYGVMSYAVTRRTREIGVRIALGATPSQVSSLIAGDGLRLALVGVAIGGTLSLPMAYALGALLFGVQIADVGAFALTCGGLVGVAIFAFWLPARRAARLDPVFALRTE